MLSDYFRERLCARDESVRADGLSPSEDCPSMRVMQYLFPKIAEERKRLPGEGHLVRGQDMEGLILERAFAGCALDRQPVVVYQHHIGHLDAIVTDGPGDLLGSWELKTSTNCALDDSYVRQVQRYQWIARQMGKELPAPYRILVVSPSGYDIAGPFTVELTGSAAERAGANIAAAEAALEHAETLSADDDAGWPPCECGRCFWWLQAASDAPVDIEAVIAKHARAKRQYDAHMQAAAHLEEQMAEAKLDAERLAALGAIEEGEKYRAEGYILSRRPGSVAVDWAKAHKAGALPDAIAEAVMEMGYVRRTKPSVRFDPDRSKTSGGLAA